MGTSHGKADASVIRERLFSCRRRPQRIADARVGVEASAENRRQVWAPAGFARGFCVLSEFAEIQYKCTGIYNNKGESGILWDDPAIGIEWPLRDVVLSDKDRKAQTLDQWLARPESANFTY
jgi:dTDP-4-dehydrorhamnose 3,5-epimerase